ncbi:hybrid sensor histidine kinase/response regulator [Acanthopleuribacter pedis]|uniref:histidine kinase n=1 Tax=Acanthopleuribacter pedis TaxID=442870 RepID=A0A8J7QMB9_9BACT|nr:ATP-binding protein [Acanthopleuribacter pedis]MBO1321008.1 response regulator [Acanthopleuribacter pedis]
MKKTLQIPEDFQYLNPGTEVTLTNCDREAVQFIDRIQEGIWVFVLAGTGVDGLSLQPAAVSANINQIAGMSPSTFMARPLSDVLGWQLLRLAREVFESNQEIPLQRFSQSFPWNRKVRFDLALHRAGEHLVLEWFTEEFEAPHLVDSLLEMAIGIEQPAELYHEACRVLKRALHVDQAILYRFDNNYNGEALAEAREEHLQAYKGLWFPDSDIPLPARIVMAKRPVGLVQNHSKEGQALVFREPSKIPVDLSRAVGRAPSVMCSRYYCNMGVHGAMVGSLLHRQRLWGFFSLWKYNKPLRLGLRTLRELRMFCQNFMELAHELNERVNRNHILMLKHRHEVLLEHMLDAVDIDGAMNEVAHLSEMIPSDGAVLISPERLVTSGLCPPEPVLRALTLWLQEHHGHLPVYFHRRLAAVFPPAQEVVDQAAGVLALRLGRRKAAYLMWFRGEITQKIKWAGKPVKVADLQDPDKRLMPRASFSLWVEQVRGFSAPWQTYEIDLALALRDEMVMVLHELGNHELVGLLSRANEARRAKERLLGNVSHDLRTPIHGILANAELLEQELENPELLEMTADIVSSSVLLTRLLNDLLDQARLDAGHVSLKPSSFRVPDLEKKVRAALLGLTKKTKVPLAFRWLGSFDEPVWMDADRVVQILNNLISNAMKHSPSGEHVDVAMQLNGTDQASRQLVMNIADAGKGIAPEERGKVLEAFHQSGAALHEKTNGVGLGLSIVRGLLQIMNGRLEIDESDRGGALMRVTLPVPPMPHKGGAPPKAKETRLKEIPSLAGYRLLVAEDNKVNQRVMSRLLSRTGCDFDIVTDGREAVTMALKNNYDLYVFDIQMPNLHGDTAIKELRVMDVPAAKVPALAVTAFSADEDRRWFLDCGFDGFLAKPIRLASFVALVLETLKKP